MLNVDIQKLLKDGGSRYELVAATAKRARMIVDNTPEKVPVVDKPVSVAVEELEEGKWSIVRAED